jgi:hypothetical protein
MSFTQDPGTGALPPMPPPPSPPPAEQGLFRGVPARNLSLGTAIEAAFRALAKPAFVIPIFAIAIVINAITEVLLGPTLAQWQSFSPAARPTVEEINQLFGALGVSLVISLVGGMIAAIYGTVWAVAASIGPFPTFGETVAFVGRRWARVLGASLLVGAITIAVVLAGVVVVVVLSRLSAAVAFGVGVGLMVALVWLVARLSMTTWLAADGGGVTPSLRGSWRITEGGVLRIIGWTFAYGFLFALISGAAGIVLGRIPFVGQGIATGFSLALSYGAGVTLFRRTQASAPPLAASAPPVGEAPIG